MPCPQTTEYNEAIQNLRTSVTDEELREGEPALGPMGYPMPCSGNFADVYKVHCPQSGNTWAVKCFTREVPGLGDRYREISAYLRQARLPFTVEFQYVEPGIRAGGQWVPFLKMRWVEGLSLNQFVQDFLEKPKTLKQLLQLWVKLAARLRGASVAHADLQHGNVLLVPAGERGELALKLIDYDGMYVPSLAGRKPGELGHPSYQHPQRLREGVYSLEVDRFSHLAIYCAIHCLSIGRKELWARFDNGDNLLFREADYRSPGTSEVFHQLWALGNGDTRALVARLALACQKPLDRVPLLDEIVTDGKVRPLAPEEEQQVGRLMNGAKARAHSAPESGAGASGTALGIEEPSSLASLLDEELGPVSRPPVPVNRTGGPVCPGCGSPIQPGAILCVQCGLDFRSGRKLSTTVRRQDPPAPDETDSPTGPLGTVSRPPRRTRGARGDWLGRAAGRLASFAAIAGVLAMIGWLALWVISSLPRWRAHSQMERIVVELQWWMARSGTGGKPPIGLEGKIPLSAVEFAPYLPYAPTYLATLESGTGGAADKKRQWVLAMLRTLPPGTDLAPLRQVAQSSFAYNTIQEILNRNSDPARER